MYVVRMAIFSWLKVTVKHTRDLPFLRIICIVAVLRLTYSGPYLPRFVKDGKLLQPSCMFCYGCHFSSYNSFFLLTKMSVLGGNNSNNVNGNTYY